MQHNGIIAPSDLQSHAQVITQHRPTSSTASFCNLLAVCTALITASASCVTEE